MGSAVIHITSKEEWNEHMKSGKTCVVDFYADWCGPCKMIASTFKTLAAENAQLVFLKVDVDEVADVAESCGITAMPTFQVYMNGNKVGEVVGASQEKLKALVNKYASLDATK